VHALHNIHAALASDGLLVDTQPISAHPRVATREVELGALDMRAWADTIRVVDDRLDETITAGLYDLQAEQRFIVTDRFDDGRACLDTVGNWRDTQVPPSLASDLEETHTPVSVEQEVRLRLVRRAPSTLSCH
jgi:hypothetical protein